MGGSDRQKKESGAISAISALVGPPKLVGVEIHGGLGNQLFQYAAAYSLAKRHGADLQLDTRLIRRKVAHRPLALNRFGITWTECLDPEAGGLFRRAAQALHIDRNPFLFRAFNEPQFAYNPLPERDQLPIFLKGYFQSWRYFADAEADIRRLFDTSRFASDRSAPIAEAIRRSSSPVMVHVRRGDYASIAAGAYELLGLDYYASAAKRLPGGSHSFFIFSDDQDAARTMFGEWPNATFVTGLSDLEDLHLMALCRHFIIANSTFSWWAAWLGKTPGKTVVAPAKWFGPALTHQATTDLIPPSWITV